MRTEYLQEWLRENQATEAAAEAEGEGEVEMLDPEGRERVTEESREYGGGRGGR